MAARLVIHIDDAGAIRIECPTPPELRFAIVTAAYHVLLANKIMRELAADSRVIAVGGDARRRLTPPHA